MILGGEPLDLRGQARRAAREAEQPPSSLVAAITGSDSGVLTTATSTIRNSRPAFSNWAPVGGGRQVVDQM